MEVYISRTSIIFNNQLKLHFYACRPEIRKRQVLHFQVSSTREWYSRWTCMEELTVEGLQLHDVWNYYGIRLRFTATTGIKNKKNKLSAMGMLYTRYIAFPGNWNTRLEHVSIITKICLLTWKILVLLPEYVSIIAAIVIKLHRLAPKKWDKKQ